MFWALAGFIYPFAWAVGWSGRNLCGDCSGACPGRKSLWTVQLALCFFLLLPSLSRVQYGWGPLASSQWGCCTVLLLTYAHTFHISLHMQNMKLTLKFKDILVGEIIKRCRKYKAQTPEFSLFWDVCLRMFWGKSVSLFCLSLSIFA